jgi:hypothetical protein
VVRFSPNAKAFLKKKGVDTVVVSFVEFDVAGTCGIAKDVSVTFEPPADATAFRHKLVEGIDVFVDRKLKIDDHVVIKRQGFWNFSSLYADGVRVPI